MDKAGLGSSNFWMSFSFAGGGWGDGGGYGRVMSGFLGILWRRLHALTGDGGIVGEKLKELAFILAKSSIFWMHAI